MNLKIPDVGFAAPDFQTITSEKEDFQLKRTLKDGTHLMMIFYRGHW